MKSRYIMIMVALMTLFALILPVSAESVVVGQIISQGATIFIGEEGLNITPAMDGYTTIGYWASGANIDTSSPSNTIPVTGRLSSFAVTSAEFNGYTGNWYRVGVDGKAHGVAFTVSDPKVTLSIRNADGSLSLDGKTIVAGSGVTFRIDSNVVLNDANRGDVTSVLDAPVAEFSSSVNAATGAVTFTATPIGGDGTFSYAWDASDASGEPTTATYTHPYAASYSVKLTVSTDAISGTPSSVTKTITVTDPASYNVNVHGMTITDPSSPATAPFSTFGAGISNTGTVTFYDQSSHVPTAWNWTFGDGMFSDEQNPTHKYTPITGDYVVKLNTSNADNVDGVHSVATATVTITAAPYSIIVSSGTLVSPDPTTKTVTSLSNEKGYMNIVVKSESGSTYSSLMTATGEVTLKNQFVDSAPFYWQNASGSKAVWKTDAKSGTIRMYQNGDYTVYVECNLNGMKENYNVVGKSVSDIRTITLGSDSLKIESNKDSVVRGKSFTVTVTGQAGTTYKLYLKGISDTITTAPKFASGQDGITEVTNTSANVITDSSGMRSVEFTTSSATKEQKYTIRVELDSQKYDEVSVSVVKGGLTLVAEGDQSYYLGEEIKLSGSNTETSTTFFFLIGPNLNSNGVQLDNPSVSVDVDDENTFVDVDVDGEYQYSYEWSTEGVDLDAGTYTIYAVSNIADKGDLSDIAYATTSVVIKKPFVSAHASQNNVAKGDKAFIEGIAEGNPSAGVAIWLMGKNYAERYTQSIESDGTFKYEISGAVTGSLSSGQYFVVVQHPMQNGEFDIDVEDDGYVHNYELNENTEIFKLRGSGSLQGSDAAEALVQAINDPNIDDTYTKLNILIEEAIIAIDSIGDKNVGDKFTVTGKTNLAVDDEILVEIYSSSFKPTQKSQSGEFSGVTQTVKVVAAESGMNKFSLDVDASTFKADEYIVIAEGIVVDATGTALFNVREYVATPTPTVVVTVPTAVITAPPTVPPTEIPTEVVPTETTKSPGFGAILALAGLIGVGFMVVRRR